MAPRTDDGAPVHRTVDAPVGGPPRARAVIVHGYAEHGGRYRALVAAWNAAGIETHRIDLPGHGRSPGLRVLVRDAGRCVRDLVGILEELQGDGPTAAFGHSFGGALVLRAAQERPDLLDAVAVTAPFLESALPDPAWQVRLAGFAARFAPTVRTKRLDARGVSRDPDQVRAYDDDPLVDRGGVRLATARELMAIGPRVLADAAAPLPPTLIVHGDADAIAHLRGSRRFAEVAAARPDADVTLRIVSGGAHALLHDEGRDRTVRRLTDWVVARLELAPEPGLSVRSGSGAP